MTAYDLLPYLRGHKPSCGGYLALCPCHPDKDPSLSINERDGKLLVHCFGCGAGLPEVLVALGLPREAPADKPSGSVLVAEYYYGDQLKKCKYRKSDGSKYCVWYHRGGDEWRKGRNGIDPGLYCNGDLSAASVVYIVEGEKDVETLAQHGLTAVSLPDGANSKWCAAYEDELSGKDIIILPDNDKPGKQYTQLCAAKLEGKATRIRLVDLSAAWPEIPDHGDISDMVFHFGAENAMQKLAEQVAVTDNWKSAENSNKPRFKTISAVELLATDYPPREFLVDDLLPAGTTVLCAPSKIGKSWMAMDLCLSIASGQPFLGHATHPCGAWLESWLTGYLVNLKAMTKQTYMIEVKTHLQPSLGAVKLENLDTHTIQKFYNHLYEDIGLSPKTIKNIHGILHAALEQAVANHYIRHNPTDGCKLPKIKKAKTYGLEPEEIARFLDEAEKDSYCNLFVTALFTGMREGELIGLSWEAVDFSTGTITVRQQLQCKDGEYFISTPKNGKERTLLPAPFVMDVLRQEQQKQQAARQQAGSLWDNPYNLVFTNELGKNLVCRTVVKHFKAVAKRAGLDEKVRFHDLRHSYAVISLCAGDDIKTVQENLGHATAAFTLDVYGHITKKMQQDSANRMQKVYENLANKKHQKTSP